jgi:hypothetical protein
VATIEAQIRAQREKMDAMEHRMGKRGGEGPLPGSEKAERIKTLETLCAQKHEENRQLRTRLAENAANRAAEAQVRRRG